MRPKTLVVIIKFKNVRPSEQRPKLSVLFSGSCPPKLSFYITIDQLAHSVMISSENDSLGGQEPENKTNNFGRSSLGSFYFRGPSGSL